MAEHSHSVDISIQNEARLLPSPQVRELLDTVRAIAGPVWSVIDCQWRAGDIRRLHRAVETVVHVPDTEQVGQPGARNAVVLGGQWRVHHVRLA